MPLDNIPGEFVPVSDTGNGRPQATFLRSVETVEVDDLAGIDDEEVPLAVIDDEEEPVIQEEEVPLAGIPEALNVNWSWIPVIGAVASTVDGYRRNRKNKKDANGDTQKK